MTENRPTIELLEETHEFPGQFTFKVIGWNTDDFAARVLSLMRQQLKSETDPPHTVRRTASNRHVAVTVEPVVDDAHHVLAIYQELQSLSGLIMLC